MSERPSPERTAAIRERAEAIDNFCGTTLFQGITTMRELAAKDVPWLLAALAAETARREEMQGNAWTEEELRKRAEAERDALAARLEQAQEALQEARQYVCGWPIGTDDEPQEQRGGPRDTMLHNLDAALAALQEAPPNGEAT